MKRLLIQVIYDKDGVIDDYLRYYLETLCKVCNRTIFVVNGNLNKEGENTLLDFSKEIVFRDNIGFDVGAYKEILESYLTVNDYKEIDEIVLSNSTCFGPFVPFEDIFKSMENKAEDFWGLALEDTGIDKNLISNFLVFKQRTVDSLRDYFSASLKFNGTWEHAALDFEIGLFEYLKKKGFSYSYYADLKRDNIYECPNRAVETYRYPLLKIRCLSKEHYIKENFYLALRYIKENTDYDLNLIIDHLYRRFGFVFEKDYFEQNHSEKEGNIICYSKERIREIAKREGAFYIYGTGYWAQYIYEITKGIGEFRGFICSDGYPETLVRDGIKAINLSKINDASFVIIGMNKRNTNQVIGSLNYRFLNIWED